MLIRGRMLDGKRVKCIRCGRTHQTRLPSTDSQAFNAFRETNYAHRGEVLSETEKYQVGYDRDRWLIAITRSLYVKSRGTTPYTQYIALCPSCVTGDSELGILSDVDRGARFGARFAGIINRNDDRVYKIIDSQNRALMPRVEQTVEPDSDSVNRYVGNETASEVSSEPTEYIHSGESVIITRIYPTMGSYFPMKDVFIVMHREIDANGVPLFRLLSLRTNERLFVPQRHVVRVDPGRTCRRGDMIKLEGHLYIVQGTALPDYIACKNVTTGEIIHIANRGIVVACINYESIDAENAAQSETELRMPEVVDIWKHHILKSL